MCDPIHDPPIRDDCYAELSALHSLGHNLVEAGGGVCQIAGTITGNIYNQDPLLGPLQDNGGSTLTMALLPGSPAIDSGDDAGCPSTDQRRFRRPMGAHCDIGAMEYSPYAVFLAHTVR